MDHLHVASQRSRLAIAVSTVVALIAALILVISPSRSLAAEPPADKIYWGNENGALRSGPLGGSASATDVFAGATPCGVAIDPAAGLIYWASWGSNAIQVGNLDGSGSPTPLYPESGPCGVAIDPAAGLIYWASYYSDAIRVGNLDGSGSVTTLFDAADTVGDGPSGVAIDPAAGQIYWSTQDGNQIQVGNLDGTGGITDLITGEDNPIGVAIDPANHFIYWANCGDGCSGTNAGTIRRGNLDSPTSLTSPTTLFTPGTGPAGVAIDPAAGKIYWGTFGGGTVQAGNLDGSPSFTTLFSGESASNFPAIDPAADKIYWGNENGALRSGPLGGSASATDVFAGATPCGVAIDPAAGLIYWASWGSNAIQVGNLDGSGSPTPLYPESGPCGVAIDPAAGLIYWASYYSDAIRVGNLDGSGSVTTLFDAADTVGDGPSGVAIDPAAGQIYWSTQDGNQIQVGNLDGTGGITDLITGEDNPIGVAIDPANHFIYWANCGDGCSGTNAGTIRRGNLDSPTSLTSPTTLFTPGTGPAGVAIDPAAGKIYWGTFGGGTVQAGNLDGSPSFTTLFSGESASNFPALVRAPAGAGVPGISETGGQLTCTEGSWAPDLLGAFLYRAPKDFEYQWLKGGIPLTDIEPTLTPTEPGSYTCQVTASNHAGSTSQTSDAFTVSAQATLDIDKFYDANANGQLDVGEIAIPNWRVQVGDTSYLTPQSLTVDPGAYVVTESDPVQTNWLHTTDVSVPVSLEGGEEATVEFGNVCLGGGGAQANGFWSNKNGQALFGADDLASMVSLNLREANGSAFNPANYNAFKSWLQKATATNMANKLSAELATMKLNVLNSKVNGGSLIYAPGTTSAIAGFATVNAVMAEANSELGLHGLTKSGSPSRSYQTVLKDALEKANSNLSFVQQSPCGFSFPPIP